MAAIKRSILLLLLCIIALLCVSMGDATEPKPQPLPSKQQQTKTEEKKDFFADLMTNTTKSWRGFLNSVSFVAAIGSFIIGIVLFIYRTVKNAMEEKKEEKKKKDEVEGKQAEEKPSETPMVDQVLPWIVGIFVLSTLYLLFTSQVGTIAAWLVAGAGICLVLYLLFTALFPKGQLGFFGGEDVEAQKKAPQGSNPPPSQGQGAQAKQ